MQESDGTLSKTVKVTSESLNDAVPLLSEGVRLETEASALPKNKNDNSVPLNNQNEQTDSENEDPTWRYDTEERCTNSETNIENKSDVSSHEKAPHSIVPNPETASPAVISSTWTELSNKLEEAPKNRNMDKEYVGVRK